MNLVPLRQNLLQKTSLGQKYGLPVHGERGGERAALNLFRRSFSERKVRVWLIDAGCFAVLEKVL